MKASFSIAARRFRRVLALSAAGPLLLWSAGCQVDQKKEVDSYRQILDAGMPDPGVYVDGQPLALRRAMALANRDNEQLGLRGEDFVQALIAKNRAVAAFLPTVSFQPSFTLEQTARENAATSTGPGGTGIGSGGIGGGGNTGGAGTGTSSTTSGGGGFRVGDKASHRLEAPVVGNMNLFRGGGDTANLRSAQANIDARRYSLLDAQATVLVNVAQVYYQVLRSQESEKVIRNTLLVQQARLKDVEQRAKNGLAIQLTVAQTRAQLDGTKVALLQAQSDVRNGRSTLALLIGATDVTGPLSDQIAPPAFGSRPTRQAYEELAAANRQDLQAARLQLASARASVDVAMAQYYPSISLNVAGFLYREFYADASKWNAILSANLPIFSAGLIHADVRLAWSRVRQAALYESYLSREIRHDVRLAYENLSTADQRAVELQDQVRASQEAYEQARNAFANDLAINLDVLSAQDQLLNAQLQLTSAQFDQTVFYLDLVRATGRMGDIAGQGPLSPATRPTSQPTTARAP